MGKKQTQREGHLMTNREMAAGLVELGQVRGREILNMPILIDNTHWRLEVNEIANNIFAGLVASGRVHMSEATQGTFREAVRRGYREEVDRLFGQHFEC